ALETKVTPVEESTSVLESMFAEGGVVTVVFPDLVICSVKEKQEKDKIRSKLDKNGKRVEAGKNLKQLQWVKEEKLSKTQKEWPKTQTQSKAIQV
nr:hypothetical protein [Tanacetum cinerariifolium]